MDSQTLAKALTEFGFRLSADYVQNTLPSKSYKNVKEAQADLYNLDLRRKPPNHILDPFFPDNINIADCVLQGPVVLQVLSVANITQPLRRQLDDVRPRMLLIKLSDGYSKASALEIDSVNGIHANCPPGTKVKITGAITVKRGKILLNNSNFTFLGGQVDQLLEVWQANLNAVKLRKLGHKVTSKAGEGPPKFEMKMSSGTGKIVKASRVTTGGNSNNNNSSNSNKGGGGGKKENSSSNILMKGGKDVKGEKDKKDKERGKSDKDTGGKKQKDGEMNKRDGNSHTVNAKKDSNQKGNVKEGKGGKKSKQEAAQSSSSSSSSASVASSSSYWQCPVCTYVHSNQEAAFLACKVCGTQRSGLYDMQNLGNTLPLPEARREGRGGGRNSGGGRDKGRGGRSERGRGRGSFNTPPPPPPNFNDFPALDHMNANAPAFSPSK